MDKKPLAITSLPLCIAFGIAIGAMVFALTGSTLWIGICVALAVPFWIVFGDKKDEDKPENPHNPSV